MVYEDFNDKVALVTGGASGIGYAIVQRLIEAGSKVVIADLNTEKLKEIESEFKGRVLGLKVNVTIENEVIEMVQKTIDTFGKLDIAFNVAGASKTGTITELEESDWDFTVDLCLKGVFLCIKHQARYMKENGGGAIVNVASLNAQVPMYAGSAYSSSKAGVEMLTKNAALELARFNIRVNAIHPGLVLTPLTAAVTSVEAIHQAYLERIPMNRGAQPEEIAGPALFLISKDASYVNGASLIVDGAWATSGYPDFSKFF
ncbi:SDR family NAD(P)-dependent oxidoreductase [Robertmurraya massiliosenegalensis]|uniref:SDR family NAD(P)-dependent oxidoreductase n=1 Tax=Robertmurraya TaxID=2837507 RepID=UPI0039A60EE7